MVHLTGLPAFYFILAKFVLESLACRSTPRAYSIIFHLIFSVLEGSIKTGLLSRFGFDIAFWFESGVSVVRSGSYWIFFGGGRNHFVLDSSVRSMDKPYQSQISLSAVTASGFS